MNLNRRRLRPALVLPTESTDPVLFARARPRVVRLEERYRCRQTVAPNSTLVWDPEDRASGTVEVVTPYDGYEHVTRDAVADVERRLRGRGPAAAADKDDSPPSPADENGADENVVEALIGHLLLVGHQDTDLADKLGLDGRFGAHGIRVPVRGPDLPDTDALSAGRLEHRFAVDYVPLPGTPKLIPMRIDVSMSDPDNADVGDDLLKAVTAQDTKRLALDADAIKTFVGFKPHLQLTITVRLTLPPGSEDVSPVIRRVGVTLPAAPSLSRSSLRLFVGGRDHDVQYDASRNELAWFDVQTRFTDQPDDDPKDRDEADRPTRPRRRLSEEMAVRFEQPGELYAQDKLVITVDAEIPGELLSATQARLFDARGYRHRKDGPLTVRSVVTSTCEVDLSHTFRRRPVSPYQSFHFDEVVPGKLRVADIQAALADQRFEVWHKELASGEEKNTIARHVIFARREDGPDIIKLFIVVEGQRQNTRREIRSSDYSNRTKFISGDLWLYVRGEAPRDARTVVHEINKLQRSLRERFRQLRVPR